MNGRLACLVLAGGAIAASGLAVASTASAAFLGPTGGSPSRTAPGTVDSNYDIFAIDPNGQNRVLLAGGSDDEDGPSYSADGEKIVFTRYDAGQPVTGRSGS